MIHPSLPKLFTLSTEVAQALKLQLPLVALESAVITHGLPQPDNLTLARDLESEVRAQEAIPATIALLGGKVHIGLISSELENLASAQDARKISRRDFAVALAARQPGGTTVAATLIAAHAAGIKVFATGGIGGVHRDNPFDVSADLPELARTPIVVVCSGAKAILDLPATLEYLETQGVPIIGYDTTDFPAFFTRQSGFPVTASLNSPVEIASVARMHWDLGLNSAVLVVNPPPLEVALPLDKMESAIQTALADAQKNNIYGPEVTPYLLKRVNELTGGASLRANLGLLRSNARLAAQIAIALNSSTREMRY